LKPKSTSALADLKSKAEKFFVTKIKKGFDRKMVACTLVFEGTMSGGRAATARCLHDRGPGTGMKAERRTGAAATN